MAASRTCDLPVGAAEFTTECFEFLHFCRELIRRSATPSQQLPTNHRVTQLTSKSLANHRGCIVPAGRYAQTAPTTAPVGGRMAPAIRRCCGPSTFSPKDGTRK